MKTASHSSLQAAESKIASLLISAELEGQAVEVLTECLTATVVVRARRGEHGIDYAERPDYGVRLAAAVKVLEFARGKPPTSLTLIQPSGSRSTLPTSTELMGLLAENPDIVRKVIDAHVQHAKQAVPSTQN